ncbi:MAG TPA: hypothetical protein VLB12_18060 [Gemmatimonadales bacterium]|nr:hypothetical protein [Gemmatimonadales bacterium]
MAQDLVERFTALHYHAINTFAPGWARWRLRNGHRCIQFPEGNTTDARFSSVLSSLYNDSGLLVTLVWTGPDALAGVQWAAAFERDQAETNAFTGASFGHQENVVAAAPVAPDLAVYTQLTFASDEIDGLQPLESYRLKVIRFTDGVAMDAFLYRVFIQNLT